MSRWGMAYYVVWLAVLALAAITNQPDPVIFTTWFALVILGPTIAIARYILGTGRKRRGKHTASSREPSIRNRTRSPVLVHSGRSNHDS